MQCPHCDETVTWTAWDGSTVPTSGHYYLASDTVTVSGEKVLKNTGDLVIDLNGKTLQMDPNTASYMFFVRVGAKVVFMDSSTEGTGKVIGNQQDANNGILRIYSGNVDIYGGTFQLTDSSTVKQGGLFRVAQESGQSAPVVNIYGGQFQGATATEGGIIYMTYAKLNISGGTFNPGDADKGDAIYVKDPSAEVSISGDAVINGGIEVADVGTFAISGNPTIRKATGGSAYSIKLAAGQVVTVGELAETAKIGLTGSGTVAEGYPTAADAVLGARKNFISDASGKIVAPKAGKLLLTKKSTATDFDCPHCDETVEWKPWDGKSKPVAAGHYYLEGNVYPKGNYTLADYGAVVLNLNGYTVYKENSGNVFLAQGNTQLVFMDSSADRTGTVLANNNTTKDGSIANAYLAGSSVTVHGGNFLSGTPDVKARNGGLFYANAGTVTIRGGEFWGTTANTGGVVGVKAGGTLEITGGVLHAGKADNSAGDTIWAQDASDVIIGGTAVIEGGVRIDAIASFTLSGTPKIARIPHGTTKYSLKTSTPAAVTDLAKGAHIRVTPVDGAAVTTAFASEDAAKAAAAYFYCDDPEDAIVLDGTALCVQAKGEGVEDLKNPGEDGVLNLLMVGNSFCYYYVEELYGLLMENLPEGITEVQIYNLYRSGCELHMHLAWWKENSCGDGYQLFRTNAEGRHNLTPNKDATLEMALAQENWDYISLHEASTAHDYTDHTQLDAIKQRITKLTEPLFGRMHELYPSAQLLWQRTWTYEVGLVRNGRTYTEEVCHKYNIGIQEVADYMDEAFCQDKPYDLQIVNTGVAWMAARELNETRDLLPYGGLCARIGKTGFGDHRENAGDGYHDGDIGGGQLLNAYIWYMTLTGDRDLSDNLYMPTENNLAGYTLDADLAAMVKEAAQMVMQPAVPEPEVKRGDMNGDGEVTDADALYLLRHTLFAEKYPIGQSGDVNGDGEATDADALYLLRYALFPDRYPLQ